MHWQDYLPFFHMSDCVKKKMEVSLVNQISLLIDMHLSTLSPEPLWKSGNSTRALYWQYNTCKATAPQTKGSNKNILIHVYPTVYYEPG